MTQLLAGLSLGLAAGLTPGPLQTLIVTSTLQRGFGAGWRVAIAPLVTDVPIVLLSLFLVGSVPTPWARGLGIAGGILVMSFGIWEITRARRSADGPEIVGTGSAGDVWRGAAVNLLSPHPWLFWVAAGAPFLLDAWSVSPPHALVFLTGFYAMLIGSKLGLAWVVAVGRKHLAAVWRFRLVLVGGGLLILGGALLLMTALRSG
jgi:threonine/homoserine/homoserine lactone efflux protein